MSMSAKGTAARVATVAVGALVALALAGGSASAGRTATPVTGTIAVDTGVARVASGTPTLAYGAKVAFTSTVNGTLGSKDSIYVTVVCTQNGAVVYQWSADPSFAFPLVDQTGDGLNWDGTTASCSGTLVWKQISGKNVAYNYLATAPFTAG